MDGVNIGVKLALTICGGACVVLAILAHEEGNKKVD